MRYQPSYRGFDIEPRNPGNYIVLTTNYAYVCPKKEKQYRASGQFANLWELYMQQIRSYSLKVREQDFSSFVCFAELVQTGIWAFLAEQFKLNFCPDQPTLLGKIILCLINWIMNNQRPWQLKKIKILGVVLELLAKQQCQFSLFTMEMGQMG